MSHKAQNPFIQFYGEQNISPVHQDVTNISLHYRRREKLYNALGMPSVLFKGQTIMEVGPGGGYNALAYFHWGASVVFIEPNPKAQEEIPLLLKDHNIASDRWMLIKEAIETTPLERAYDIIIAEGFIPGLHDREAVITALSAAVAPGGIIAVTCVDDTSILFEHVKRMVAAKLIAMQGAKKFEDKVDLLVRAFGSHLKKLKYASRPIQDWVADVFLNPATYGKIFSIADCIHEFGEDFEVLGGSPNMFTNYSWYKDMDWARNKSCLEQFACKRHNLLLWDAPVTIRDASANRELEEAARELRLYAAGANLESNNNEAIVVICRLISKIIDMTKDLDSRIGEALTESIRLLQDDSLTPDKVAGAEKIAAAFGRGQQYVSLVKKTPNHSAI